ncbi:hypothetical protein PAXRUDRAFT_834426 [Paxillus rubicundulus Ve08.2h10]|uniref:Uncharacterized protein n=1 Tax=Paxillus rubicundulus Ve08.2h10 TaxID=930991 RepID=A0A0D0CTU1_9AGAM|nr:hypothetical protein PAXRUDRAFT_834426 [Paxillus rubicundulus Ve08.2h10]
MWIRCVEGGPNESKIDPTSQKRTRHFMLEIHDTTSKQLTRTRNGLSQPACKFSAAPVHFQMPTLAILTSPARFRHFHFQRTCMFSTHPYIFSLARVFSLTHAFLVSPVHFLH